MALEHAADPAQILGHDRAVEPELTVEHTYRLRSGIGAKDGLGRTPRDEHAQGEHGHGHHEQGGDQCDRPANQRLPHGTRPARL